jgi:hypothetical protein
MVGRGVIGRGPVDDTAFARSRRMSGQRIRELVDIRFSGPSVETSTRRRAQGVKGPAFTRYVDVAFT